MTEDNTDRYLDNFETTPKIVKAGLRAWSERLATKRAAQGRSRSR